jgi:hypothetical protein
MKKKSIYLFSALIVALFVAGGGVYYEASANGLILTSPNGGETLSSGGTCAIQWVAPSEAVSFKLTYSLNNGKKWKVIDGGITGSMYDWTIPTLAKTKTTCLVKITGYNSNGRKVGVDKSDAPFTILVGVGDLEGRVQALEAAVSALQTQLAD